MNKRARKSRRRSNRSNRFAFIRGCLGAAILGMALGNVARWVGPPKAAQQWIIIEPVLTRKDLSEAMRTNISPFRALEPASGWHGWKDL